MAEKMTECKVCGESISTKAKACPKCGAPIKKPIYKRWWFIAIIAVLLLMILIGSCSKGGSSSSSSSSSNSSSTETKQEETAVETNATEEADVSKEYKNALKKAESYSKTMHMSKQAIYDQLTSEYGEQFPEDAAQYAIDHLDD